MITPHVSNRLPRDLGSACVKMAGKVMDEHVMVSCLKRFSFHLCAFLLSWKNLSNITCSKLCAMLIENRLLFIQLFRERLSEKMCTRQSRKVIWDMIDTLFLTTVAVEPTLFLPVSTR